MELVFVHIAEHKILKNISFDINSRFKCHFNNGELSITTGDRLDNYYNDILISAVIGKNGVGKTSFFEFLQESYYLSESSGVLVWFSRLDETFYICPINCHLNTITGSFSENCKTIDDVPSFYKKHNIHQMLVDNIAIGGSARSINKRRKNRLIHNLTPLVSSSKSAQKSNLMKLLYFFDSSRWLKSDRKDIRVKFDFEFKHSALTSIENLLNTFKTDEKLKSRMKVDEDRITDSVNRWKELLMNFDFNRREGMFNYLLIANLPSIVNYLCSISIIKKTDKKPLSLILFMLFLEELSQNGFDSIITPSFYNNATKLAGVTYGHPGADPEILAMHFQRVTEVFYDIGSEISSINMEHQKSYSTQGLEVINYSSTDASFILHLANLISKLPNLISNNMTYGWIGISSGELAKIRLFAELYYSINNKKNKDLNEQYKLIVIDEADLYLHPEWQRTFISELIEFLSHEFNKDNLQVIVSTHSPIIISDFLSDDIISLNKEHGRVKAAKSLGFGTQISDLYLSGMHLKSTFGEHSKKALTTLLEKGKASELNAEDMALIKTINNENIQQMITGNIYD